MSHRGIRWVEWVVADADDALFDKDPGSGAGLAGNGGDINSGC
jgi:hypothetical protein